MKSKTSSTQTQIVPPITDEDLSTDAFFSALDVAFEEIQMDPTPVKRKAGKTKARKSAFARKTAKSGALDVGPMQQTYITLAKEHLKPISRYLKAIRQGISSKELLEVITLIVEPLSVKTKKVGLPQHAKSLRDFNKVVKDILAAKQKKIKAVESKRLVFAYALVKKDFGLNYRGHSTAVLNVLAFYRTLKKSKKVKDLDIKRLFAIGVPSITMLRQTSLEELSSLTGIHMDRVKDLRDLARNFTLFELV